MKGPKELAEDIRVAAGRVLDGTGVFVLDTHVTPGRTMRIRVIVDGDTGVTIDDCARVSRELNQQIGGLGVTGDYNLEVTTPGVDQPLRSFRQFPKHIGRNLRIVLRDRKEIRGKLLGITIDRLSIAQEPEKADRKAQPQTRELEFSEIEKAFVLISFK